VTTECIVWKYTGSVWIQVASGFPAGEEINPWAVLAAKNLSLCQLKKTRGTPAGAPLVFCLYRTLLHARCRSASCRTAATGCASRRSAGRSTSSCSSCSCTCGSASSCSGGSAACSTGRRSGSCHAISCSGCHARGCTRCRAHCIAGCGAHWAGRIFYTRFLGIAGCCFRRHLAVITAARGQHQR